MSDAQNTTETPVATTPESPTPTEVVADPAPMAEAPAPEVAVEEAVAPAEPVPTTPEEEAPSAEFAAALAAHDAAAPAAAERAAAQVKKGQKVKARVVSLSDTTVVFDIGARSEATADAGAFKDDTGAFTVAVDEIVDLFVLEAGDTITVGKSTRASGEANAKLQALREAHKNGVPVTGRVTAVNTGGLVVDVAGVRAFCPISQIENGFCADASVHVGKSYEFMVTKVGESKRDIVVSRRDILKKAEKEAAKKMLANLKEGDQLEGRVVKAEGFGVFVDLGGVQGMIHVSELAHGRVGHPSEVVREGEKVRVQVLRVEGGEGSKRRIALSMKALLPDPWTAVAEQFVVGSKVQGQVTRLADFGAFVQLAPGVEGLVHVSEAALTRVAHVKDVMNPGDTLEVQVLGVDPAKRRVSLSVRQALGGAPAEPRAPREPRAEGGESRPRRGGPGGGDGRPRRDGPGGGGRRDGGRREGGREREDFSKYSSGDTGPSETPMAIALRKAMEEARRKGQIQ